MRRRYINQARIARQLIHDYSFTVDRYTAHLCAERFEQKPRRVIPRIFNCDSIAGRQKCARNEIERLLCTVRDRDVVSRNLHAARDANVARDGFAQTAITSGLTIYSAGYSFTTKRADHQASPRLMRKKRCVRKTTAKVELRRLYESSRQTDRIPYRSRRQRTICTTSFLFSSCSNNLAVDVRARANPRDQVTLAGEPVVRHSHRGARDLERVGQISTRRQTVAGPETTIANRVP